MRTSASLIFAWLLSVCSPAVSLAAEQEPDPVMQAVEAEVQRAMELLSKQPVPPYYLAVEVTESSGVHMIAEEGALHGWSPQHLRRVDVDLRLGSPQLDSTHPLRGASDWNHRGGRALPLTDDPAVIRRLLWREIDQRYAAARERWAKVQSDKQTLVEEDEKIEDLAPVEPVTAIEPKVDLSLDTKAWEDALRRASAALGASRVSHDGSVRLTAVAQNQWFVSSDGTRLRHGQKRLRITGSVDTVADDGDRLRLMRSWEAHREAELPKPDDLVRQVEQLNATLAALRQAPAQEPYTGPAVLSGRAAAVFFHEILGHRLEGHRLKQIKDAQTFRSMKGERILPAFLSVTDDPTQARAAGEALFGHYRFDNQGVPAQRTELVRQGVLVGFLESRSPSSAGVRSNGHGRRSPGLDAVTRQGNFLVEASRHVPEAELRKQLLEQVRKAGLEYGLWIEEIHGGFTFTRRNIPNAFNVNVVLARRVYLDGRPDELVRGMDFIGTPLVTFSRIVAAGDKPEVFNGYCGAESGSVPVSAVAPALLLSQIETQRKARRQNAPPLLPPPQKEVQP